MLSKYAAVLLGALPAFAGFTYETEQRWSGATCDLYVASYGAVCIAPGVAQSGTESFTNADAAAHMEASVMFEPGPDPLSAQASAYAASVVTRTLDIDKYYSSVFQFDQTTARAHIELSDELDIFAPISTGTVQFDLVLAGFGELGSNGYSSFTADSGGSVSSAYSGGAYQQLVTIPFIRGQAVSWTAMVDAAAGDTDPNGPTGGTQASARFDMVGIQLLDEQGAPVTDWSYKSASLWQYSADGGEMVPEPGSMWLTGAGALGLAFVRRLRSSRSN